MAVDFSSFALCALQLDRAEDASSVAILRLRIAAIERAEAAASNSLADTWRRPLTTEPRRRVKGVAQ
jgi:hypothetical protein